MALSASFGSLGYKYTLSCHLYVPTLLLPARITIGRDDKSRLFTYNGGNETHNVTGAVTSGSSRYTSTMFDKGKSVGDVAFRLTRVH
jgi:hypothetical protein